MFHDRNERREDRPPASISGARARDLPRGGLRNGARHGYPAAEYAARIVRALVCDPCLNVCNTPASQERPEL